MHGCMDAWMRRFMHACIIIIIIIIIIIVVRIL